MNELILYMDDTVTSPTGEQVPTEVATGQDQVQTEQPEAVAPSKAIDPLEWLEKAEIEPEVKESLKAGYLRQADYTKKTQEIAALRRKAELFDQLQQSKQTIPVKEIPEEDQIPDEPKEFLNLAVKRAVEEARNEWRAEREMEMAESLDPRLSTDESFATDIARIVATNTDYQNKRIGVLEATRKALDEYKANHEKVRQSVITELNQKAKNTTVIPSESGSPLSTAGKSRPKDMQEAAQMAEEELSR